MLINFECPKCDGCLYERLSSKGNNLLGKLVYLNWVLNPIFFVSELIFGIRVPKAIFICKSCDLPLHKRMYIHCSFCYTFSDTPPGRFGKILCPACFNSIEVERNLLAKLFSEIFANKSKDELSKKSFSLLLDNPTSENFLFLRVGITFGILGFLTFVLIAFLLQGKAFIESPLVWGGVICASFAVSCISGFTFKIIYSRKGNKTLHLSMKKLLESNNEDTSTSGIE